MRIHCVCFDLDGTLVDSRDDIAAALDDALARHGHPRLGAERASDFVGDGARMLVERALVESGGSTDETDAVLATYLDAYRACHLERTTLYPGVAATLDRLVERGVRCAVVTNKPHEFSLSLLEYLGVADRFVTVVGGDSTPERKPSPAPVRAAIAACGSTAAESAMVGDGDADVRAGLAVGAFVVGVTYGFRDAAFLRDAGATTLIDSIDELPALLE